MSREQTYHDKTPQVGEFGVDFPPFVRSCHVSYVLTSASVVWVHGYTVSRYETSSATDSSHPIETQPTCQRNFLLMLLVFVWRVSYKTVNNTCFWGEGISLPPPFLLRSLDNIVASHGELLASDLWHWAGCKASLGGLSTVCFIKHSYYNILAPSKLLYYLSISEARPELGSSVAGSPITIQRFSRWRITDWPTQRLVAK